MTEQAHNTNEYSTSCGVLIIENITIGEKKKSDIIREIVEYIICSDGADLMQSFSKSAVDSGLSARGEGA